MRRVILTVAATVIGLVLLLTFKTHSLTSASAQTPPAAVSTPSAAPSTSSSESEDDGAPLSVAPSAGATTAAPTTKPTTTAPSGTRTVQGDAVDTRYGAVQVAVTLSGKSITKITIVQIPQREPRDIEINNYAAPILTQEALQAQSANINMVSGATYTSQGYIQSLQSALDKA